MKRSLLLILTLCALDLVGQTPPGKPTQSAQPAAEGSPASSAVQKPAPSPIQKKLEAYLRKLYAWGPSFRLNVGPFRDGPLPEFYEVPVEVTFGEQSDSAVVYVSKDGRFLLRGDMQDMSADPLAAVRSRIRLANNPSKGPADAPVTIVEYADFQCPSCRQLHQVLRGLLPSYPQVRFVFKDFPLTQIHPWAMTAAIAGRCAYQQNPDAFWKLHDSIFDSQDVITPENAWQKTLDLATQAGLETDGFRACMSGRQAAQAVQENIDEGKALKVANTPTAFVNGRRFVGGDRNLLEQYIQYELATPAGPSTPVRPAPAPTRPRQP